MSLTDQERSLVRRSLRLFAEQTKVGEVQLSRVIPWLAVGRSCVVVPRLSEQTTEQIRALMRAPDFTVDSATRACALARAELMPGASGLAITVVSCPMLPADSSTACTREANQQGCDACAGRHYYAKTDSATIWMAANILSAENRTGGAEFLRVGNVGVSTLAEFVLMHEFAHVLQTNDNASFATATSLYNDARAEIPAALLSRISASDGDALEFAANSFAHEFTRSDRRSRESCESPPARTRALN